MIHIKQIFCSQYYALQQDLLLLQSFLQLSLDEVSALLNYQDGLDASLKYHCNL